MTLLTFTQVAYKLIAADISAALSVSILTIGIVRFTVHIFKRMSESCVNTVSNVGWTQRLSPRRFLRAEVRDQGDISSPESLEIFMIIESRIYFIL